MIDWEALLTTFLLMLMVAVLICGLAAFIKWLDKK